MRDRKSKWFCMVLVAASLGTGGSAMAQVAAFVNGSPITVYDLEQRAKYTELAAHKKLSRQEVLNELIDEKIKLSEVQRYGLDAPKAEVERSLTNMASRGGMSIDQFKQGLAAKGVGIETVTSRLRADMAWGQLVRARFPATLQVGDKDINEAAKKKGGEPDEAVAYDYRLRQILFIVPKGSATSVYETRSREAEALRSRFENCDSGISLARGLRDVAVRDPVRRSSTDLPQSLREILNSTPVGKLTKPEATAQGVAVFAVCEKKENTTDTPQKRAIQNELFNARFDAQSKRYLNDLRRQALIEIKIK